MAQSVVSAYETGRREPGLRTLSRLIAATGQRLTIGVEPSGSRVRCLPDTRLGRRLRRKRAALIAASAKRGADNLRVFGSVARGDDGPDSDVDLLVDLAPGTGLVGLGALERELADILGADVDLVPADSLKPRVRAEAERNAIPL